VKSSGQSEKDVLPLKMFLVPCSCGTTFAAPENYDRRGTAWSRYLICPACAKRHDPKNRLSCRWGISARVFGKWTTASRQAVPRAFPRIRLFYLTNLLYFCRIRLSPAPASISRKVFPNLLVLPNGACTSTFNAEAAREEYFCGEPEL
jgi:hypothetical protein